MSTDLNKVPVLSETLKQELQCPLARRSFEVDLDNYFTGRANFEYLWDRYKHYFLDRNELSQVLDVLADVEMMG